VSALPHHSWGYGTVLRRKSASDVLVMVVARLDATHMQMTLLADPRQVMTPLAFYEFGHVFNWTAGFSGWEVVDA
jgi:hypothetical protein